MIKIKATVQNDAGIHCRPTAVIIKTIGDYAGTIDVSCESGSANPRSMLGLMSLGLAKGTVVEITVDGPDEQAWSVKMKELFEFHFDFPPA
ncbi:MAG: HPr family phosphocarrier protein [Kiritimatiellia bacterium]|jgi:phosphocarrier protein HPr